MRRTIALLACATALPIMPAAARLKVSGTSRVRLESIDGQARTGFNDNDTLLNLRTTIAAQYEDGPVKLVGELWDSRVYGNNAGTPLSTGDVNALQTVTRRTGCLPPAIGVRSPARLHERRSGNADCRLRTVGPVSTTKPRNFQVVWR